MGSSWWRSALSRDLVSHHERRTREKSSGTRNGPHAPTGYGRQTALFCPLLAEDYEVWISANFGLEAAPIVWNGIPVLPGLGQSHGNETLPGHANAMFGEPRGGLVVTLYDTVIFDSDLFKRFNVACWTPIDHSPPPPPAITLLPQLPGDPDRDVSLRAVRARRVRPALRPARRRRGHLQADRVRRPRADAATRRRLPDRDGGGEQGATQPQVLPAGVRGVPRVPQDATRTPTSTCTPPWRRATPPARTSPPCSPRSRSPTTRSSTRTSTR